jgi:hypothetical protein
MSATGASGAWTKPLLLAVFEMNKGEIACRRQPSSDCIPMMAC